MFKVKRKEKHIKGSIFQSNENFIKFSYFSYRNCFTFRKFRSFNVYPAYRFTMELQFRPAIKQNLSIRHMTKGGVGAAIYVNIARENYFLAFKENFFAWL